MSAQKKFLFSLLIYLPIALAIFLFLPKEVFATADVVINEFSSATNPEWVELHNLGSTAIVLDGWALLFQDDPDTTQKVVFTADDIISENGYKLVERGYTGTQAWLRNDGDTIILKNPDGEVDVVRYGDIQGAHVSAPDSDHSAGRSPNGTEEWVILDSATPGAANSPPVPTPTLTPTPTPTLGPTSTPTSKLPTSTPTPKPPTPTPTKKPTPTPTPSLLSSPTGEILSEATPSAEEASPTSQVLGQARNPLNLLPKILIGAGILLLLISGAFLLLPKIKRYNGKNEEIPPLG